MNTKLLMTASAVTLGIIGITLSFISEEIVEYLNIENRMISILFLQLIGALYLGFSLMNWMAKGTAIGGIYNRPIVIGNLMHFGVGGIALAKMMSSINVHRYIFMGLTVIYAVFALSFAIVFRTNPIKK